MRKILITGGAGFIGSHLAEALLGAGAAVVVLDNFDTFYDPGIKRANLGHALSHSKFTLVEGDIRNRNLVRDLFAKHRPETVVHLAARAGVRPSIQEPILYSDVNVTGTVVLLEACRKHGTRKFVFGSSSSVYGNSIKVPFSETDDVDRPVSPYAATKRAGEIICSNYHALFGLHIFCLRFFTVYGPRQRPEMAIHRFTQLLEEEMPLEQFGDGTTSRDYTYISDIVDGLLKAVQKVEAFEIVNLGGSKTTRLTELISKLESRLCRKAQIVASPEQPGDVRTTWADVTKAERLLGYRPKVSIDQGLDLFVEWYRKSSRSRNTRHSTS